MMNRFAAIVAQGPRADAHAGGKTSKRGVRAVIRTQEMKVYVLGKVFVQKANGRNSGQRFRRKAEPRILDIGLSASNLPQNKHVLRSALRHIMTTRIAGGLLVGRNPSSPVVAQDMGPRRATGPRITGQDPKSGHKPGPIPQGMGPGRSQAQGPRSRPWKENTP